MKNILSLFIIFFIGSNISFGKDTITVYYDSDWEKVRSIKKAVYYRKAFKDTQGQYIVKDYFLNGDLQMSGTYITKKFEIKNGTFIYYYDNGQKKSEYNYVKNKRYGDCATWFDSGQIASKSSYDANGKTGKWIEWFKDGGTDNEEHFLNDLKHGECTYYHYSGKISAIEYYTNGKFIRSRYFDEQGSELPENLSKEVDPEFVGGEDMMARFIQDNIKYPSQAVKKNIKGTSYIHFIVQTDGSLSDVKVLKSAHPLLDAEAIRVIKKMPNWIPGKQYNRVVRVKFVLPIRFNI